MPTKKQPAALNKPFVLICLFVASTLTATLWQGHEDAADMQASAAAPAQLAAVSGHGGDKGLPVCGMPELSLTARCQPRRDA